jgi:hypothetical protein
VRPAMVDDGCCNGSALGEAALAQGLASELGSTGSAPCRELVEPAPLPGLE